MEGNLGKQREMTTGSERKRVWLWPSDAQEKLIGETRSLLRLRGKQIQGPVGKREG